MTNRQLIAKVDCIIQWTLNIHIVLFTYFYLFICPSYGWVKFDPDFFIEMFLYTFWIWIKFDKKYISFQTLMSATPTNVSMVLYVLMELMDIHVCVQQGILESTVKQVRIRLKVESKKVCYNDLMVKACSCLCAHLYLGSDEITVFVNYGKTQCCLH